MSANPEFIKQGGKILDFIDAYGALRLPYLEKFFPHSSKIVGYLLKNKRLHKSPDRIYISTDPEIKPNKCLIAALGVLADIFDKVKSHARAAAPVQVSFITHAGDYYEIIYIGCGMEAMVAATLETQLAAKDWGITGTDAAKRIIIIEDTKQIDRLQIPQTARFALVLPDGSLTYFRGG